MRPYLFKHPKRGVEPLWSDRLLIAFQPPLIVRIHGNIQSNRPVSLLACVTVLAMDCTNNRNKCEVSTAESLEVDRALDTMAMSGFSFSY